MRRIVKYSINSYDGNYTLMVGPNPKVLCVAIQHESAVAWIEEDVSDHKEPIHYKSVMTGESFQPPTNQKYVGSLFDGELVVHYYFPQ